jgi:hypothetical protein
METFKNPVTIAVDIYFSDGNRHEVVENADKGKGLYRIGIYRKN